MTRRDLLLAALVLAIGLVLAGMLNGGIYDYRDLRGGMGVRLNRLTGEYGLSRQAASHLMGQVVRYDVGNVFDPAYTMVCRIDKKWLPKR